MSGISVEFCGEWWHPEPGGVDFTIGREGDLAIDDNPWLHRHFLSLRRVDDLWWLLNVGSLLSATVSDRAGYVQAWLAPGARLPLVFAETVVLFTAGPTSYEVTVVGGAPLFDTVADERRSTGDTTLGPVLLTESQKLLLVALAEPLLRRDGTGSSSLLPSVDVAARLGWPLTTFNRKLDNVCDKLDRSGVRGLRGTQGKLASNRRARLVEHVVASRLVTSDDLPLLDS